MRITLTSYDLSFLDIEQTRSDDKRIDFGDLAVVIASKDIDKFDGASLDMSDDDQAPGLTMDNPNTLPITQLVRIHILLLTKR